MQPVAPWQQYLPYVVIAVVFLIRMRRTTQARRMHLGRLAVAPVLVALVALYLAVTMPPDLPGAGAFAVGAVIGGGLGWQRARLMKIVYDPASDTFTLQQSPLAVALLVAIMLARRLLLPSAVAMGGGMHSPHALWLVDGLIGFGLATVIARNVELWLRAKALRAATLAGTFA